MMNLKTNKRKWNASIRDRSSRCCNIDHGLQDEPCRDACRQERSIDIRRSTGQSEATKREKEKERDNDGTANKPELLAQNRKDRIGIWKGEIARLLTACPQSYTKPA